MRKLLKLEEGACEMSCRLAKAYLYESESDNKDDLFSEIEGFISQTSEIDFSNQEKNYINSDPDKIYSVL